MSRALCSEAEQGRFTVFPRRSERQHLQLSHARTDGRTRTGAGGGRVRSLHNSVSEKGGKGPFQRSAHARRPNPVAVPVPADQRARRPPDSHACSLERAGRAARPHVLVPSSHVASVRPALPPSLPSPSLPRRPAIKVTYALCAGGPGGGQTRRLRCVRGEAAVACQVEDE